MTEPWDAKRAGSELLASLTQAIAEERAKAHGEGRVATSADLARAVLRSSALQDANRKILDNMMDEYEPRVAALVAAEAASLAGAAVAAERERIAAAVEGCGVPGVERRACEKAAALVRRGGTA